MAFAGAAEPGAAGRARWQVGGWDGRVGRLLGEGGDLAG